MSSLIGKLVRILMPVVVLFGACIGFYYLSIEPPKEEVAPAAPQVIRTRVAKLPWIDYQVNVTTRGVVQSHNQVELHAQVSGEIVRISPNFEVGAYFKAGEILAEISSRDYQIAVEAAKARCDGAAANLSLATRNVERNERLSVENAISRAELDELIATQELMAAELESAEAQLERARRDLERTMIVAPYDGRVLQRTVSRGQAVAVGTVLGTVFSTDYAEVRLPIAAKDLRFLDLPESEEDPPLSVELRDSLESGESVRTARIVRTEGALDQNSLDLFVIARIEDPFGRLSGELPMRIGQPVEATIAGKRLSRVMAIPRGAIRQLDQIYLVDQNLVLQPRTVSAIWMDRDFVIIRDETIPADSLVATTQLVFAPQGAKVEILPSPEGQSEMGSGGGRLHLQDEVGGKVSGSQGDRGGGSAMEAVAGNLAEVGGSDGVAFDYDLDGHEDFVACDGKKISFFRNLGSGDWKRQEGVLEDASSLGDGLSLGDCNSDRLIDLLLWRPDESERQDMDHAGVAPRSKSFVILLNQGDGTFLRREVGVREMRGDFESIGSVLEAGVP